MEEKVREYLIGKQGVSEKTAQFLYQKIHKYPDIYEEFLWWLDTGNYKPEGICVEGYTAEKIFEIAPQMNGMGVFNVLVGLRDETERTLQAIEKGFPRK